MMPYQGSGISFGKPFLAFHPGFKRQVVWAGWPSLLERIVNDNSSMVVAFEKEEEVVEVPLQLND